MALPGKPGLAAPVTLVGLRGTPIHRRNYFVARARRAACGAPYVSYDLRAPTSAIVVLLKLACVVAHAPRVVWMVWLR